MQIRYLFIRDGGLGDCLLVLPLLEAVKAADPAADIHYMAPRGFVPLLSRSIAQPCCWPIENAVDPSLFGPSPATDRLRPFSGFDRIYSFHGDSRFISHISAVSPIRYLDPRPTPEYIVHHLAKIIREDGIQLVSEAPTIMTRGEASDPSSIFIHPGGGTGRKRWAIENYRPFIESLRQKHPHIKPVLLLGEAESDLKAPLANLFDRLIECAPLVTLAELVVGRPYLGMDSGISHLAAASGAHVLALFGPTDPRIWAQRRPNYEFLAGLETLDSRAVLNRMTVLIERFEN